MAAVVFAASALVTALLRRFGPCAGCFREQVVRAGVRLDSTEELLNHPFQAGLAAHPVAIGGKPL